MKTWHIMIMFFALCSLGMGCVNQEKGCTDLVALNYNPNALRDNGDCLYALPVPSIYQFKRKNITSVDYRPQVVLQLLIEAITTTIEQTAQPGASPIDVSALNTIYQQTDYNQSILSSVVPYSPSATQYTQIAASQRLAGNVVNTLKADSMLLAWFDTIATRSQNAAYLGTSDVHTTSKGIDLLAATKITLLSSVALANSINLIRNISTNSNSTISFNNNYTPMENAWDKAWGFFGSATVFPLYPDLTWTTNHYQDQNSDQFIDFTSEYNFAFATLAAQRDLIGDENTDFSNSLFNAWVSGRTAITNQSDVLRTSARETILSEWQKLIAASAIHYLNSLKIEMENYATPNENIPQLNLDWTSLWAYLMALRYFTDSDVNVVNLLILLGEAPLYATLGTDEYNAYLVKLNLIGTAIQQAYAFSDYQMQNW